MHIRTRIFIPIILLFFSLINLTTLAQESLFMVFLNSNPDKIALPKCDADALQQGHLDNIEKLYEEGKLLLAGPFEGGGGVFILKANTLEEAKEILSTDPAISADRFIVETMLMEIQKGWICDQQEPYKMIMLSFIQFHPSVGSEEAVPYNEHYGYVQKDDVLFEAALKNGESIEFFAVIASTLDAEVYAASDPLVLKGDYEYEIKKWWTTDQTFCSDKSKKIN